MTIPTPRHARHDCGGTLLAGNLDGEDYRYCDAYGYGDEPVPAGTDHAANVAAWDAGKSRSPDAAVAS